MKPVVVLTMIGITVLSTGLTAWAGDAPLFRPPHGMFNVELDENNKLFSNRGAAAFSDPSLFTTNALGQIIFTHSVANSIAERDGDDPLNPGTATSTKLLTDDPGFRADADTLPLDYVLSVSYLHSLQYFAPGGSEWTLPSNMEQIRVFDLSDDDDTGGVPADLELTLTGSTAGVVGTINIDNTEPAASPVTVSGLHGMMGYELSRTDALVPAVGAYMIELQLSMHKVPNTMGDVEIQDSDSIFVVFNNQMDSSDFASAVSAAETLPEPTSLGLVVASGTGMSEPTTQTPAGSAVEKQHNLKTRNPRMTSVGFFAY